MWTLEIPQQVITTMGDKKEAFVCIMCDKIKRSFLRKPLFENSFMRINVSHVGPAYLTSGVIVNKANKKKKFWKIMIRCFG
jgi:hypothetical protein